MTAILADYYGRDAGSNKTGYFFAPARETLSSDLVQLRLYMQLRELLLYRKSATGLLN